MRGITVVLHVKTQTGTDSYNNPVYSDGTVTVDNVLPGEPTADDLTSSVSLYGRQLSYMLGIPKGDTHEWEDTTVEFFGHSYHTFGKVIEGVEDLVPTPWHRKIRCELYE